jgi:hypothetical protein
MSIKLATKELVTQESVVTEVAPAAPVITSFVVNGTDDLALDPAGGQTIVIKGKGFRPGLTVIAAGSTIGAVTLVDSTTITFTSEAQSSGTYNLFVINQDGGTAILSPGLIYSGLPTFTTEAGSLGSYYETTEIDEVVVAEEDQDIITYSVISGSLPSGATLNTSGYITGTSPVEESSTTYTFTVEAVDEENQSTTREFSLTINVDVVTWVTPSEGTIQLDGDEEMTNVTLLATSAAGYNIDSYTANTLPAGVLLSGNTVYGTPSTEETVVTTFTATSNTTNRTATRTVTWVVSLGDAFFNQTTLLLNADNNTFITDVSTNAFTITPVVDTRPSAFSPYNTNWSVSLDGSNDYLTVNVSGISAGTSTFTLGFWVYLRAYPASDGVFVDTRSSNGASTTAFQFGVYSTGALKFYDGTETNLGGTVPLNTWTHVQLVRDSGNTVTPYINGTATGTTVPCTRNLSDNFFWIGCVPGPASPYLNAYISNLFWLVGSATAPVSGGPTEPQSTSTTNQKLLVAYGNRFADFNTATTAKTVTVSGGPKVMSFGPFTETDTSTGSGYFDGTGDYLTVPDNAAFDLPGDFTAEFFVYATAGNARRLFQLGDQRSSYNGLLIYSTTGNLIVVYVNGAAVITGPTLVPYQWVHVACVREGTGSNNLKLYVNGSLAGQVTNNVSFTGVAGNGISLGAEYNGSFAATLETYISDFRLVKGTAVYSGATYTVPTTSLPAISGTSLLTLQNRISYNNSQPIDESGIKNVITRNGNVNNASAGTFSPHVPTGWSAYFDGSDYLGVTSFPAFGTGDFTVEWWAYKNDTWSDGYDITDGGSGAFAIYSNTNGQFHVTRQSVGGAAKVLGQLAGLNPNQWYYFAVVRQSGNVRCYVNGSPLAAAVADGNSYGAATKLFGTADGYWPGYISNFRVFTSAIYNISESSIPVPTEPFEPATSSGVASSLLILRSPTFNDESPSRLAITRYNDSKITAFSPFAPHTRTPDSHSVYFDGTGDYLGTTTNSSALTFGTGDFTIEGWVFSNNVTLDRGICQLSNTSGGLKNTPSGVISITTRNGVMRIVNAGTATEGGLSVATKNWFHFAFVRISGVTNLYVNGVKDSTFGNKNDSTNYNTIYAAIGGYETTSLLYNGYISNFRVVKGTAVYTSAFNNNLPTAPLTAISGTSLLTCQSPTVIDNSSNAFALTVNGNSQPTQFNPFGETVTTGVEYAPASHGGSVYFDGTGDYLSLPSSTDLSPGSGDFTVEAWVYPTSTTVTSEQTIISYGTSSNNLRIQVDSIVNLRVLDGASLIASGSSAITTLQWNHVAIVRSGSSSNNVKAYINGIQVAQGTSTATFAGTASIGGDGASRYFNGYISNHRIVKGTAVYTSAFVPPAAPATPIAGTTLLVNGTNAAIQDRTGRNVLETVGNTRTLPESPYRLNKSVYFDGTGDYLTAPIASSSISSSTSFTIEFFVYWNVLPTTYTMLMSDSNGNSSKYIAYNVGAGTLDMQTGGSAPTVAYASFSPVTNTWYHLAFVRDGTTVTIYVNGSALSMVQPTQANAFLDTGSTLYIGRWAGTTPYEMNGYISNLRIVKGTAIVPPAGGPTSPLTVVSGTSLLTCQSYNFKDNSTNNFTITRNVDAKVTSRGPFTETQTENNAMYFDGTGDYLTTKVTPTWANFGTSDFTIECWVYFNSVASTQMFVSSNHNAATGAGGWTFGYRADNTTLFFSCNANQQYGKTWSPSTGTWYHVAVSRSGTDLRLFVDGTQVGSTSTSSDNISNAADVWVGSNVVASYALNGFIDDLRITKGVARTITVPTSAFKTK